MNELNKHKRVQLVDHRRIVEEQAQAVLRSRRATADLGDYIDKRGPWDWFATFTSRRKHPPNIERMLSKSEIFLQKMQEFVGHPIKWALVGDVGQSGKRPHVHAVIACVAELSIEDWRQKARRMFGRSEVKPYVTGGGAAHYLAKRSLAERGSLRFGGRVFEHESVPLVASSNIEAPLSKPDNSQQYDVPNRDFYIIDVFGHGADEIGRISGYAWRCSTREIEHVRRVPGLSQRQADYFALISALRHIPEKSDGIIYTGSFPLAEEFNGRSTPRDAVGRDLLRAAMAAMQQGEFRQLSVLWRPRSQNLANNLLEVQK